MVNLLEDDKVAGFKKAYDCGEFDLNTENSLKKFKYAHYKKGTKPFFR